MARGTKLVGRQGLPIRTKSGEGRTNYRKRFVPSGHAAISRSSRTGRTKRAIGYR